MPDRDPAVAARLEQLTEAMSKTLHLISSRLFALVWAALVIMVQNSIILIIFWLASQVQARHIGRIDYTTLLNVAIVGNVLGLAVFLLLWRRAERDMS